MINQRMKNIVKCHQVLVDVLEYLVENNFTPERANPDGYWIKSNTTGTSYSINFWRKQYTEDPSDVGIHCKMDGGISQTDLPINENLFDDVIEWITTVEEQQQM